MPKFWLRAFAESGHVTELLRDGREHRTPVKSAAKERNFNSDPLAQGAERVALETYLAEHVDNTAAPVIRSLRAGSWPLAEAQQGVLRRVLAWQLVRTHMFRSWNVQVGKHLSPVIWAHQMIAEYQQRLGRMLTQDEGVEIFWIEYHRAPDQVFDDAQWHLRAPIRALAYTTEYMNAPGRELVLMRSDDPYLILGDTGVSVRRTSGTYSVVPPLLGPTTELFAPLSPTHLLLATPSPDRYRSQILTPALARQANKGAAAWCQKAVYRLPSMRWPRYLRLDALPRAVPAPRIAAAPAGRQGQGSGLRRPELNDPELLRLLQQFGDLH